MDQALEEKWVGFTHPLDVAMTGIDGTWSRDCKLAEVSENGARLIVEGRLRLDSLALQEFFLLLTPSAGTAFRRCELKRVNGHEVEVRFLLRGKRPTEGSEGSLDEGASDSSPERAIA
jgi:hypothetical protein